MIILELDGEHATAEVDPGPPGRPPLVQPGVDTDDLPYRPRPRIAVGSFREANAEGGAEMMFQGGVVDGMKEG